MNKIHRSYLSSHRRRWGITQAHLGFLLGVRGSGCISRIEEGRAEATLAVAFGLHVVFGKEPHELFPTRFSDIEEAVLTRAYNWYDRLQGDPSKATKVKLDFLEEMFERAKHRRKTHS